MNVLAITFLLQLAAPPERVAPVLQFPEPGLDDPAAYEGYQSRFYRDALGNTLQVYINQSDGRVVHVWGNAANESLGLSFRNPSGAPASLAWVGDSASVDRDSGRRSLEYRLRVDAPAVEIGHFLLGSMRLERDFQYEAGHRRPFSAPRTAQPELTSLIANLERLGPAERQRHLALLQAATTAELRGRLQPTLALHQTPTDWRVRIQQPSFDGRNRLVLELRASREDAEIALEGNTLRLRSRRTGPIQLALRVETDSEALTPLRDTEIFNSSFLHYLESLRVERDSLQRLSPAYRTGADDERLLRLHRVERQVKSTELLSSHEKLMAGLPNYATYFGRDMLMTALMMEPVWTDGMVEYVIATALRKLSPGGEVSHEEALGGQAVRENAAEYNRVMAAFFDQRDRGAREAADSTLAHARTILSDLQRVRENYHMVDDDFQLPVLVAGYLANPGLPAEQKRAFLQTPVEEQGGATMLTLVLRNMSYAARMAEPYVNEPAAVNLVGFPPRSDSTWSAASWRDSGVGYANGRFAMDVNVTWVPAALESIAGSVRALRELGWSAEQLRSEASEHGGPPLHEYLSTPAALREAVEKWNGTARHFLVVLSPGQVGEQVQARLSAMPPEERQYWSAVVNRNPPARELRFLALSLDAGGRPIPVVNTDVAMRLFVDARAAKTAPSALTPEQVLEDVRPVVLPYPLGLLIPELGPVVANDAYARPEVWEAFVRDHYHSPRVVWGREVNLLQLGLARQIEAAVDSSGTPRRPDSAPYVRALRAALQEIRDAVYASGLGDQELWTYQIEHGRLLPVRYVTGNELQLWNLTDLAVQYELARLFDALH